MREHCRVSLQDMKFQCAHCGATEGFSSGAVLALEEKMNAFRAAHEACEVPTFKPGDRVSYCGEIATVVENHGTSGTVEIPGQGRMNWYWEFQGEPVIPVRTEGV